MRFGAVASVCVPILGWCIALTTFTVGMLYASGGSDTLASGWGFVDALADRASLVLPLAAFAGGLAAASIKPSMAAARTVLVATLVAGGGAYCLGAVIAPIAEYRSARLDPETAESRFPRGAWTPVTLLDQYTRVSANPPTAYSLSTDTPDLAPPNWLMYRVQLGVAAAVFSLVSGLLGLVMGWLTIGLSPPRRRRARWVAGLMTAVGYLGIAIPASKWVRRSPANSALLAAWLPVVVGLIVLSVLLRVARRESASSRAPGG